MLKKIAPIVLAVFIALTGFAQKKSGSENATSLVDSEIAAKIILQRINKVRLDNSVDTLIYDEILMKASITQAEIMAANGKATTDNGGGKYPTTGDRVKSAGGTNKAEEIVITLPATRGKDMMPLNEIVEEAVKKWSKKELPIIINQNNIYVGASMRMDASGKKAFISVVFGGFKTFNKGGNKKARKKLKARYTKKNKKLHEPDKKTCKNCDKFSDYEKLLDGVYVENGKIYLKYDDLKGLSKLLKGGADGLAVDIVQKAQYNNPDYNIINNNLQSKGILKKTVNYATLLSKNRIKPEKPGEKINKMDAPLAKFPKKVKGEYEINLLVIQGGSLCKTLIKSYTEQGDQASNTPLTMLLMQDSAAYFNPPFVPKSDTATLKFTIPFEKNKSDYKEADLLPFINSLKAPDFIISGLYITAYSSIEGDEETNVKLQKKRSESIIKALGKMKKSNAITDVKTSDSWELFKMTLEDTEFKNLTKMNKDAAIKEINTKPGLSEQLEPYLSKQRFGEIMMKVTYDISGAKEEKYSIVKFNEAVKKGDVTKALKIQYYIAQKVREGKYSDKALSQLEIPMEAKFSGILNNQIVFNYYKNDSIPTNEDYELLKKLAGLDPSNAVVSYNRMYCALKLDSIVGDAKARAEKQAAIDALNKTVVPEKFVNALNIEWQFKVIKAVDTIEGSDKIVQGCIGKIKSFFNIKESTKENNLKLAYIFAKFKDYQFASNLLANYIKEDDVSEPILFAYISFASHIPDLVNSRVFSNALKKAEKANHEKYCKLFGPPFLSFQVLDNPLVKEDYNKAGCK